MNKPERAQDACECCGNETEVELFKDLPGEKNTRGDAWYCALCAGTLASSYHRYPSQTPTNQDLMKAVCFVGNAILKAIAELPQKRSPPMGPG